jgi:hypothetical protein
MSIEAQKTHFVARHHRNPTDPEGLQVAQIRAQVRMLFRQFQRLAEMRGVPVTVEPGSVVDI